jgi:hypothetical protein
MDLSNPLVIAVVVAAALALVVYRQLLDRPVGTGQPYTVPLLITAVGVFVLVRAQVPVTGAGIALSLVELLAVAGLGVLRGRSIRLFRKDGVLHQRGGALTIGLWVLTIGVRVGLGVLAASVGAGALTESTLALSLGISLLVQAAVVQRRVRAGALSPEGTRIAG